MTIKLKHIIFEGSNDCEELFGKFLFGEYEKFYGSVKEKDTKFERETFSAFLNWVESSGGMRNIVFKYLDKLMQCKKEYPKVLEPNQTIFYRVITLPRDNKYVADIIELESMQINRRGIANNGDVFWNSEIDRKRLLNYVNFSMDYIPKRKIESWSTSKSNAIKFAIDSRHVKTDQAFRKVGIEGATFIIKATIPDDEVVFNPKFMNKMAVDVGWWPQNEVIRYSKSKNSIKVDASYVTLIPQLHKLGWYDIPKNMKNIINTELKTLWSNF